MIHWLHLMNCICQLKIPPHSHLNFPTCKFVLFLKCALFKTKLVQQMGGCLGHSPDCYLVVKEQWNAITPIVVFVTTPSFPSYGRSSHSCSLYKIDA
jgi:hypothetical protein